MSLIVSSESCPHPQEHLKMAVNKLGPRALAPIVVVFCMACRGAWTPDTIPADLLDRCLGLFEGMRS